MPKIKKPKDLTDEQIETGEKELQERLRSRGWKEHEIDAALGGYEYAFDIGHNQVESDQDAALDMASSVVMDDRKKWGKRGRESCADVIYEGIVFARKLQEVY